MQSVFFLILGFLLNRVHSFLGGYGGFGGGGIGLGLGYGLWGGYPGFGFPWLAPPLGYQINSGSIYGSPGVGFYYPGDSSGGGSYSGGSSSYSGSDASYGGGSMPGNVPPTSPDIQNKALPSAAANLVADNIPAKSMPGMKSGVQGATLAVAQSGAPALGNTNESGASGTGSSGTGTGGGSASGSSGGGSSGGSGGGGGGGGGSGR